MTTRQLTQRQVRWTGELADFEFEIKFCPGSDSSKPDILFRKHEFKPKNADDEIIKKKKFQLLKERWLSPVKISEKQKKYSNISAVTTRSQDLPKVKSKITQSENTERSTISSIKTLPSDKDIFDDLVLRKLDEQAIKNVCTSMIFIIVSKMAIGHYLFHMVTQYKCQTLTLTLMKK